MNNKLTFAMLLTGLAAFSQVKVGDNPTTVNTSSLLELESANKGLLLPRVALTSTTAASPLGAHVRGMHVYNTATAGTAPNNVTPGEYYNDSTKWVRLLASGEADATSDAFVNDNTNTMVKLGTNSDGTTLRSAGTEFVIKNDGKVGIGTTAPTALLDVKPASAAASGLRLENISDSKLKSNTSINYNSSSPVYIDINGYVYKKINPVLSSATATTFDGTHNAKFGNDPSTNTNIVSLTNGSILRFQIYTGFVLGFPGTGANLYADVTYSYVTGFRVSTYASETGGTSTSNTLTITGEGTQTLTFDFNVGNDLVLTSTFNNDSGNLQAYYTGQSGTGASNVGDIAIDIFQSFRSR